MLFHNLREGLFGLTALIQANHDEQAAELAAAVIDTLSRLMNPDGTWNIEVIRTTPGLLTPGEIAGHDALYCSTGGRLIGALVKYYEVTGNGKALEQALRAKNQVLATCFTPEGRYTPAAGWHVHSITATINSLAQLAECQHDTALMEQTHRIYLAAFDGLVCHFGWSKENLSNDLETGEVNNTGDIMQTALILARNGYPELYSDVEKMLRSHVFPSQLLDTSWVKQVEDPRGDFECSVRERSLGAFGFPAPYGHKIDRVDPVNFNFDITCGAMQALCEVLRNVCTIEPGEIQINLPLSQTASGLQVRSCLPERGALDIETAEPVRLLVRLPQGVAAEETAVIQDGNVRRILVCRRENSTIENGYVVLPAGALRVSVQFNLPETQTVEKLPSRTARIWWKGETVVRMEPTGTFLPFYQD